MIFKCKNCGGNSVYSPETKMMYCPHCESADSHEKLAGVGLAQCGNCGAPMDVPDYRSAMKCESCGSYHIFEERMEGEYTPHLILPFQISKNQAVETLRKEFGRRVFTPSSFLSHASVAKMEGTYVPFFLYDFDGDAHYRAQGTKKRSWTSGSYRYTETSYYAIERDMDVDFARIPVDASTGMDDRTMDLLEPYNYQALQKFQDQFVSGFLADMYSDAPNNMQARAEDKAKKDTYTLLRNSVTGYATVTNEMTDVNLRLTNSSYALLPVWVYDFSYQGKTYTFHVNGQTGKVIGKTPVAHPKVLGYSATVFGISVAVGFLLRTLMMLL